MNRLSLSKVAPLAALAIATELSGGAMAVFQQEKEWSASLEALFLWRNSDSKVLVNNGGVLLDLDDADHGFGFGVRGKVMADFLGEGWLKQGDGVQFVGMYVGHDGSASRTASSHSWVWTESGTNFVDPQGFDTSNTDTVATDSSLFSLESNYLYPICDTCNLLIGSRSIWFRDDVKLTADVDTGFLVETLDVKNCSSLLGLQVGVDCTKEISDSITLCGDAKAGAYWNRAERELRFKLVGQQINAGVNETATLTENLFAGVFELNLHGCKQVSDRFSLFVGGQLLYLTGVATGKENLVMSNTAAEFNKSPQGGSALYAGVVGGGLLTF